MGFSCSASELGSMHALTPHGGGGLPIHRSGVVTTLWCRVRQSIADRIYPLRQRFTDSKMNHAFSDLFMEFIGRIYWISHYGQPTRCDPPAWGLGEGITTPYHKKLVTKCHTRPRASSCEHGNEPSGNFLSRWVTVSFSRRTLIHGVSYVDLILRTEILK